MPPEKPPKNLMEVTENLEFIGWPAAFRSWFDEGKRLGATHVIYCYMRTGENQYFPRYVMQDQDVREEVSSVSSLKGFFTEPADEVAFVFSYSQPFETQWALTKNMTEPVFNFD